MVVPKHGYSVAVDSHNMIIILRLVHLGEIGLQ